MADGLYFVRAKGKVTGSYDLPTLQKLVKRGLLTQVHEVSEDRINWVAAGEYQDLFPLRPVASRAPAIPSPNRSVEAEDAFNNGIPEASVSNRAVAADDDASGNYREANNTEISRGKNYFYSQNGLDVGPVPLAVLKSLAQNGTLRANDLVWQEDASTTLVAQQMSQLASVFSGGRSARSHAVYQQDSNSPHALPADGTQIERAIQSAGSGTLITSLIAAVGMLLAFNLPWGVIDHHLTGWWMAFNEPGTGGDMFACIFFNILLMATCLLAPLLTGMTRGIVLMAVAGAFFILMLVLVFLTPVPSTGMLCYATAYLIPILALGIGHIGSVRGLLPNAPGIRRFQGTIAGGLALFALVISIVLIIAMVDAGKAATLLAGFIFILIAMFAALAAGVLAFVNLKSQFSAGLNVAMSTCAYGAQAILLFGFLLIASDFTSFLHMAASGFPATDDYPILDRASLMLIAMRLLIICFGFVAVITSAMREFTVSYFARTSR